MNRRLQIPDLILAFFIIDLTLGTAYIFNELIGRPSVTLTAFLDLNQEGNLPTWYSSIQWFCAATLLGIFAHRNFSLSQRKSWVPSTLPLLFLALSLDEIAQIHEWLGHRSDIFLSGGTRKNTVFSQTGIWMFVIGLPFLGLFVALILSVRIYFQRTPGAFAKIFLGALIMLAGAIEIETLSNFTTPGSVFGVLQVLSEEFCEMLGGTIVLWGSYELVFNPESKIFVGVTPISSVADFPFSYSASNAKVLLFILLGFEFLLVLGYTLTHIIAPGPGWGPIPGFLNVDREASVPTWCSSIQLFAVAVMLLAQAPWAKQLRFFLFLLGLGFLLLSMDEAAGVHDSIRRSARRLELRWLQCIHYLFWMALYACIGLVGLLTNYRSILFAWRNFRREAIWVAVGGAIFVGGGIGIEALSHYLYRIAVDERFLLAVAAEELLEMAGVSVMLYGVMLLGIRIQSTISM